MHLSLEFGSIPKKTHWAYVSTSKSQFKIQSTSEPSISDKGFSTCMRRGIFRTAKSLTFDRRKKSVIFVIFPLLIFSKYSDPKALPCEIRAQWYGLVYARAVHCSQCAFPLPVRLLSSKTSPNNTPCLWKKGWGSCIRQGTPLSVWTESFTVLYTETRCSQVAWNWSPLFIS